MLWRDEPCAWLTKVGVSLRGNDQGNGAPDGPKWTAQNNLERGGKGVSGGRMGREEGLV